MVKVKTNLCGFLSNLNDIFLSVGLVLLFLGLIAAASILSFGAVTYKHLTATICIPLAVIAWALSEYFCARRRMLLPSIVLASLFTLFVGVAAFALSAWIQIEGTTTNALNGFSQGQGTIEDTARALSSDTRSSLLITCGASIFAAFLFYLRFRLPFTMMLMAINVTSAAFLIAFGYETLLLCGVLCLLAAIAFDARDPQRTTRISDNGFWLHVAAWHLFMACEAFWICRTSAQWRWSACLLIAVLSILRTGARHSVRSDQLRFWSGPSFRCSAIQH